MSFVPFVLLGSLGLWLGMPNPVLQLPLLVLLYPASLYCIGTRAADWKQALRAGWICGLAAASACLYWIAIPVHDFGGLPWLLAVPCPLLMGAYVGLYGGLFSVLSHLVRFLSPVRRSLLLGLGWYLLEGFRGWFLSGFPWLSLASAFAPWPVFIQGASLLGAYGLGGLYAGIVCLVTGCFQEEKTPRRLSLPLLAFCVSLLLVGLFALIDLRAGVIMLFVAGAFLSWFLQRRGLPSARYVLGGLLCCFVLFSYSVIRLWETDHERGEMLSVALIQGNLDQNVKWEPNMQRLTVQRYLTLSREALAFPDPHFGRPALLVWPETAMPFNYETHPVFPAQIREQARREEVSILFGAPGFRRNPDGSTSTFNRAYLVGPDGMDAGHYEKSYLVPFGEYTPRYLDIPFLRPLLQGVGTFTPGERTDPLRAALRPEDSQVEERSGGAAGEHSDSPLVQGPLICYEAIFPGLAREQVLRGATLLVNISNDAWFGRSSAPEQHLQQSVLRAVEQGRWLVRATNTGISAVIAPTGTITVRGSLFRAEVVAGGVVPLRERTLFFYAEPWLPWIALACLSLLFPWRSFRRRSF